MTKEIQKHVLASMVLILVFFSPQIKSTPQLTPRKFLNLPDQRSSLMFESCDAISITSLGTNSDFTGLISTHIMIIRTNKLKKIFLHFTHSRVFLNVCVRVRGRFVL